MNGQSGKHFSSVEEFYNATRPENIDALCRELYAFEQPEKAKRGIFPESDGEWISWKRSLPDFAELLCDQEGYGRRTAEEGRRLERALEAEIALLRGLKDSPELAALRKTNSFAGLCGGGSDAVRKAVNKSFVSASRISHLNLAFFSKIFTIKTNRFFWINRRRNCRKHWIQRACSNKNRDVFGYLKI